MNVSDLIKSILDADERKLRDASFLSDLIRPYTRDASGYPACVIIQDADEWANFLIWTLDKAIMSVLDIGTWKGGTAGTLAAYLRKTRPHPVPVTTIDITMDACKEMSTISSLAGVRFHQGTSHDFKGAFHSLVVIDGDHTTPWIDADYNNVGQHARYTAFHDISEGWLAPEVRPYWNRLRAMYHHVEFVSVPGKLGLGVLDLGCPLA